MTDRRLAREAVLLKEVDRSGWTRIGVPHPESVAAHSWGVALLALLRCPPELDRHKLLAMAILHDLAEVRVGDLT
ncbi:MAG: HD domain-containing protein, partial [Myxococcota bacterium]